MGSEFAPGGGQYRLSKMGSTVNSKMGSNVNIKNLLLEEQILSNNS